MFGTIHKRNRPLCRSRRRITAGIESLESRQLLALTVGNLPALDVTAAVATIGADVSEVGNSDPTISVYWGDEDGGTDIRGWDRVESLGSLRVGQHTIILSGLVAGTDYYYRAFAFSFGDGEQAWASESATFRTDALAPARPSWQPDAVVGDSSALVKGSIDGDGSLMSATLYFGEVDGGNDPLAWDQMLELEATEGEFSTLLTGLLPGRSYSTRLAATNAGGTGWSESKVITTVDVTPRLRIGEVMPANASTLPTRVRLAASDRFAGPTNTHDWIEIQNASADPFDLDGYYLSDSEGQPQKWEVPAGTQIPAYGSIVVFASGLDVRDPNLDEQGILHANFSLDRDGEFISLSSPDGRVMHQLAADASRSVTDVSVGYFRK